MKELTIVKGRKSLVQDLSAPGIIAHHVTLFTVCIIIVISHLFVDLVVLSVFYHTELGLYPPKRQGIVFSM